MRRYSQRALEFLPSCRVTCRSAASTLRVSGHKKQQDRELPTKKRNDLLHVDAFPTRPTGGDLILRVFTNINLTAPRVWLTSDPFEPLAQRYAMDAGLRLASTIRRHQTDAARDWHPGDRALRL